MPDLVPAVRPKPVAARRSPPRPDALLGVVLGGSYRVDAPLARGGMGALYRGTHLRLQRPVAVKVLAPAFAGSETARRRFRREARALARLHSPHVVDVLDVLEAPDGRPVLITELLQGEDLGQRIERAGALPVAEALDIGLQLAEALTVAHEAGVVHRDLKPSNVFLCERDGGGTLVKLLDFGVARVEDDAAITRTGVALGTPLYMAPEQVRRAAAADARSDVYGAGAVLYHALTGHAPYPGGNATEALARVLDGPPPAPSRRKPGLPFAVEELVLRAMAREPEGRFANAAALGERLARLRERMAPVGDATPVPSRLRDKAIFVGGSALMSAGAIGSLEVLGVPAAPFAAALAAGGSIATLRRWPALGEHLTLGTGLGFVGFAVAALVERIGLVGSLTPFLMAVVTAATAGVLSAHRSRAGTQRRSSRGPDSLASPSEIGSSTTLPSDSASRPAIQRAEAPAARSATTSPKKEATPSSARSSMDRPSSSSTRNPSPLPRRPSARRMTNGSASAGY